MKRSWLLKAFLIAIVFVSSCTRQPQQSTSEVAVKQSAAGVPAGAHKPLDELADLLIGRWRWEINLATDYPGVGKKGEKVAGYETCRSRADRTAIECEFVFGKATETWLFWWDASSNRIRSLGLDSGGNWYEGTISKQANNLVWKVSGSFADGRPSQVESETTFEDNGDTRVITGATTVGGVRNEFRDVGRRVWK